MDKIVKWLTIGAISAICILASHSPWWAFLIILACIDWDSPSKKNKGDAIK